MASFYEWQLVLFVLVCVTFLVIQRYMFDDTKPISTEDNSRRDVVSKISRQYLCVYALAMGMFVRRPPHLCTSQQLLHRCGLAARSIYLLCLQGTAWPIRTSCRAAISSWVSHCGCVRPSCRRLGRSVVRTIPP
ncbi:hypothetical protein BC628DRAFT_782205 [Trametes gibbosa]|nr:hypothetical protein BC628DRAFT_782205 [Trametes gibbosa]